MILNFLLSEFLKLSDVGQCWGFELVLAVRHLLSYSFDSWEDFSMELIWMRPVLNLLNLLGQVASQVIYIMLAIRLPSLWAFISHTCVAAGHTGFLRGDLLVF